MPDATTASALVTNALFEIGACSAGDVPAAEDATFALGKLNRLIDRWNAEKPFAYRDVFQIYTLTPSTSPETIGPTGGFGAAQRPQAIIGANLTIPASSPSIMLPIEIRDAQWWLKQRVKSIETSVPTDLYYEPTWPDGSLYFWPVPNVAYGVQLQMRFILVAFAWTDSFSMPPGYEDALTLSLAEELATPYGAMQRLPDIARRAQQARGVIATANYTIPDAVLGDGGMPTIDGTRGSRWNYLTGNVGDL